MVSARLCPRPGGRRRPVPLVVRGAVVHARDAHGRQTARGGVDGQADLELWPVGAPRPAPRYFPTGLRTVAGGRVAVCGYPSAVRLVGPPGGTGGFSDVDLFLSPGSVRVTGVTDAERRALRGPGVRVVVEGSLVLVGFTALSADTRRRGSGRAAPDA